MLRRWVVGAYLGALLLAAVASFVYKPPREWGFAQELATIPDAFQGAMREDRPDLDKD
jgi:hypothetical protein